jgi:hypothetical protein
MKNILKALAAFGVAATMIHSASAATGPVLSIGGSSTSVNYVTGDTVTFTLNISGLKYGYTSDDPKSPSLGAFDLVLDYDPTVLSLVSDSFGSSVTTGSGMWVDPSNSNNSDLQIDLSSAGQVNLNDISGDTAAQLDASQAAAFSLGTVTFEAIGAGSTQLTWDSSTSLSDETGVGTLAFTTSSNQPTISAVPEPSTYGIALCGLGLLLVIMSKRGGLFARRSA